MSGRTFYCYICADQDRRETAVSVCTERNKPVCEQHARGCAEGGHGTSPLYLLPTAEEAIDEYFALRRRAHDGRL